jgi:hypothetical protein
LDRRRQDTGGPERLLEEGDDFLVQRPMVALSGEPQTVVEVRGDVLDENRGHAGSIYHIATKKISKR